MTLTVTLALALTSTPPPYQERALEQLEGFNTQNCANILQVG